MRMSKPSLEAAKRIWKWVVGKLFLLTFGVGIVFGVGTIPFLKNQFYLKANVGFYLDDVNSCLREKKSVFIHDGKTSPQILGGELFELCKKDINALRGFLYEKAGILAAPYIFSKFEEAIRTNAESSILESRGGFVPKPRLLRQ